MAVISISRQYGSGGDEIAARVCEILGYRFFDKALMAQLASEVGLSEDEVIDYSEMDHRSETILGRLASLLTTAPGESPTAAQVSTWQRDSAGTKVRTVEEVSRDRSVTMVRQSILAAHKAGNVVIVGRGGQAVLREMPGVLHVRVEAPLETRMQRIQEQQNLSLRDAEWLIRERDRASAHYVKLFHDVDLSDPMLYHLEVNAGRWETEAAAQLIVSALSYLPGTLAAWKQWEPVQPSRGSPVSSVSSSLTRGRVVPCPSRLTRPGS